MRAVRTTSIDPSAGRSATVIRRATCPGADTSMTVVDPSLAQRGRPVPLHWADAAGTRGPALHARGVGHREREGRAQLIEDSQLVGGSSVDPRPSGPYRPGQGDHHEHTELGPS